MTESKTEKLFTIREAADVLGVSQALIYALCSSRKIRHERHGLNRGRIRIPQDALDEYRRGRTVDVKNPPPPRPLSI
ncbi:MAG: helix-turn-helix domain-containing protein, partial [Planctomycetota bacterium]